MRQAISLLVKRWALNAPALLKSTPEDLGLTRETGFPVDYTLPQSAGGLLPPMEVFNQMWGGVVYRDMGNQPSWMWVAL